MNNSTYDICRERSLMVIYWTILWITPIMVIKCVRRSRREWDTKKKMVFVTADIDCGRFFCFIPMSAPTQHTGIGDLCVCNREREWGGWSIKTFGFSFRDQACTWVNGNWDDFVFVYAPADTFGLFRMCFWCSSLKSVPSLYVFFCFVLFVTHPYSH